MNLQIVQEKAPLYLYIFFYTIFSLIGITFFLVGNDSYLLLYEAFSGVYRPFLSGIEQKWTLIIITYLAPLAFIASFLFANKKLHYRRANTIIDKYFIINKEACVVFFVFIMSYVIVRIFSIINLNFLIYAYTNYSTMINVRFYLFQELGVFDWILLYSFIPTASGILYYKLSSYKARYINLFLTSFILLFTMQKRYILLYFIFIFFIHFFQERRFSKNLGYHFAILTSFLIFIFSIQTFLPQSHLTLCKHVHYLQTMTFFSKNELNLNLRQGDLFELDGMYNISKNASRVYNGDIFSTNGKIIPRKQIIELNEKINTTVFSSLGKKNEYMFKIEKNIYHFFTALLNRTSLPAVYYFELFPERLPFLGLNLNYFLPLNERTNEGKLIWNYINGNFAENNGAIATPFNFSLYARVGVLGTLLVSLLLGFFSGALWSLIQSLNNPFNRSILSSIFCIYMIFMSMDNFKSSVYFTYGVFWWIVCFLLICLLSTLFNYFPKRPHYKDATV